MTKRLYENVDLLTFTASVVACVEKNGHYAVTLDQTAFFPEGGGQGADHGSIGGVHVLDAHEIDSEVVHTTDGPLTVGSVVECRVDPVRRLSMMQQHSGEHIFSGLVHQTYGYDNVGFHIGTEAVTMDFNGMLTMEQALAIEQRANEAIWRDVPVKAWIPDKEELSHLEYRSKKAIEGDLRIVQIEGCDTCACCGTHVHSAGSVGQIKVVGLQKYKSGVRVSILCGMRALEEERIEQEQLRRIAVMLSGKMHEAAEAVAHLKAERDALTTQKEALGLRLFEMLAMQETGSVRVVDGSMLSSAQLRKAAAAVAEGARCVLVLVPKESGWNFVLHSPNEDIRPATKGLCDAFGGRGGGLKDMTQGNLSAGSREQIREKLLELMNA